MRISELDTIENELGIELPTFYKETMLNYLFSKDSFAYEFSLCADYKRLIDYNGVFESTENLFAVGSDGGESIYYIRLDRGAGSEVYIFDLEGSDIHRTVDARSWTEYLIILQRQEDVVRKNIEESRLRKKNKKWWQIWI